MKYTSPLHLLPAHNNVTLDGTGLKRWKQELLLQFELNQSATLEINEQEYDKNSILAAFELLKDSPEHHLRLYANTSLLDFIEHGYIDFFDHPKNWADWINKGYLEWLRPGFIEQFGNLVYECTSKQDEASKKALKKIYDSGFVLPEAWRDEAYQKTYRLLSHHIELAEATLHEDPVFIGEKVASLKPGIDEYLNEHYTDILDILPNNFEGIRQDYGDFAHNVIYYAFSEGRRYYHLDKETMLTVAKAAEIDVRIRDDEYAKKLLKEIKKRDKRAEGCVWLIVIGALWGIYKLFAALLG